jgi:hypothetical protein
LSRIPSVRRGRPHKRVKDRYQEIRSDGISIWKSPDITSEEPNGVIEISLEKHLLVSSLILKGARTLVEAD